MELNENYFSVKTISHNLNMKLSSNLLNSNLPCPLDLNFPPLVCSAAFIKCDTMRISARTTICRYAVNSTICYCDYENWRAEIFIEIQCTNSNATEELNDLYPMTAFPPSSRALSPILRCTAPHSFMNRVCRASLDALGVRILSIHWYSGSSFTTNSSTKPLMYWAR